MKVPVSSITVAEDRQRRDLPNITDLAQSIQELGLIHPIVVDEDLQLIAGGRRLAAVTLLEWQEIDVRQFSELSEEEKQLIELEENTKREDLDWKDRVFAITGFTQRFYPEDPGEAAEALGYDRTYLVKLLTIEEHFDEVQGCDSIGNAYNMVTKKLSRERESQKEKIAVPLALDEHVPAKPKPKAVPANVVAPHYQLIHGNFLDWAKDYEGERFNLIHCDFPYGVKLNNSGQAAARYQGDYADQKSVYETLLHGLVEHQHRLIADSAHMIFWFSMNYYRETVFCLENADWKVDPFPLIWHRKGNKGILPDYMGGYRRVYETALFCTRGERKLARQAGANLGTYEVENNVHPSQKPIQFLRDHMGSPLIDNHTRLLDPTCGSGVALAAAFTYRAEFALGIEMDEKFFKLAEANVAQAYEKAGL